MRIVAIALVVTSCSDAYPPLSGERIGIVGCSITSQTIEGYIAAGGKDIPRPGNINSGMVITWAETSSIERWWQSFTNRLPYDAIWWQTCSHQRENDIMLDEQFLHMETVYRRIRSRTDSPIWINGLPDYGGNCTALQVDLTVSLAEYAVNEGMGFPLPRLIAEQADTIADGCHLSDTGIGSLGDQLLRVIQP